jgi:hypothetical protein
VSFLAEALSRVRGGAGGPVLECGSGISTILMGALNATAAEVQIWALENDARWLERITSVTRQYQLGNVQRIHAPFHRMPQFHLVICDGPTEATPGGRYGLLPVMAPHLADDAVVLVDDADTAVARGVLARWTAEGLARVELRESPDGMFGIVTAQKHAGAARASSIT